jgi:hypothetical protein
MRIVKPISLKLKDEVFYDVEEVSKSRNMPRNTYINEAVDYYNKIQKRNILKEQLKHESMLTRKNSLKVLHEFENLEENEEL